ncbi:amid-like nadh [Moniliophthora roreri MCA 2997]|uniref:Amid-like nadh n=1 Tax=Moniliophthora roreri (strain MCA 2997) TaxID=1381753 RepID=V2XD16_MONRO|nr:amid-like nadh [Moniliophthora roreri MCA 2997]
MTLKTVAVLGASYGGNRAAQILAAGLPEGWRIVLVDRNTHFNHVYVLPRLAVLPGHEHKAFVPYTRVFWKNTPMRDSPHIRLHAHVLSVHPHHIILSKAFPEHGVLTTKLEFDYLIYALGSHLPSPLNLWGSSPGVVSTIIKNPDYKYNGTKEDGINWLKRNQKVVEDAPSVLVVGGGALGIQFATDIAHVYPTKAVTLLHSRHRLMPKFDNELHLEVLKGLESIDVNVILGERLDLRSVNDEPVKLNETGQRVVRTVKGREVAADLILLCTGQIPNTGLLKEMDESTVNPDDSLAHVLRTMQLGGNPEEELKAALEKISLAEAEVLNKGPEALVEEGAELVEEIEEEPVEEVETTTPYPHIFAVGDAADAFGAIAAGHTAYWQGEVAARNVIRLIKNEEPLEHYHPGPPAIKVSLGLQKSAFQANGVVGVKTDGGDDLHAPTIWKLWGYDITDEKDMYA